MSMHLKPMTPEDESGLRAHGLPVGTPSHLADAFRFGVAWADKARAEPQPDADGWIPWEGGECPVLNMSRVDVVHRNGDIFLDRFAGYAQAKTWTHDDHPRDIIAYRVVEAQP